MTDHDRVRCEGVVQESGRWPTFHQCERLATVQEVGQGWCKTHAPSSVKARRDASEARYRARMAATMAPHPHSHPDVLALVQAARSAEWATRENRNGDTVYECTICESRKEQGHEEGCDLAAALAPWEEQK